MVLFPFLVLNLPRYDCDSFIIILRNNTNLSDNEQGFVTKVNQACGQTLI